MLAGVPSDAKPPKLLSNQILWPKVLLLNPVTGFDSLSNKVRQMNSYKYLLKAY